MLLLFLFKKILLWWDWENLNIGVWGGFIQFFQGLTVTCGEIDLFCSPHTYVRIKDFFLVISIYIFDTDCTDVPFKSVHLIKKSYILKIKVKIVGNTFTLFVTNNYGENSEDFMLNVLNTFDLDIVKCSLVLKDGTPQYVKKFNKGQTYLIY